MKKLSKLFRSCAAILMLAMMVTSLIGCGGKTPEPKETTGNETSATSAAATTEAAADDPMTPYAEEIEMVFGNVIDPNSKAVADMISKFNEPIDNNRWIKLIKDKLNIKITYKHVTGWANYEDGLKLLMASNDLPDYFAVLNWSDYQQMCEAGAIQEMGPLFDKYASPLTKKIIEDEGKDVVYGPLKYDGKIYGIPRRGPSTNNYTHLFIRRDWLNKLNLTVPTTMDEVKKVAQAFATQDPDGDNKKDTYGLGFSSDYLDTNSALFWGFGAYPNIWVNGNDGKLAYGTIMPQMKDALKYLSDLYKGGLIDSEFGTKNDGRMDEDVASGKVGMFYGHHWKAFAIANSLKNDPTADWIVAPMPSVTGAAPKIGINPGIDAVTVVSSKAKNPEALVKIYNLFFDKLFGDEFDFSFWSEPGIDGVWSMAPIGSLDPYCDLNLHRQMKKAVADNTTDALAGTAKGVYAGIQQDKTANFALYLMFGWKDSCFNYVDDTYPQNVQWNAYFGRNTKTMVSNWTSMEELISTSFVKFIYGKEDIDAGFDKMVEKWYELGGKQIVQEIEEIKKQ